MGAITGPSEGRRGGRQDRKGEQNQIEKFFKKNKEDIIVARLHRKDGRLDFSWTRQVRNPLTLSRRFLSTINAFQKRGGEAEPYWLFGDVMELAWMPQILLT